MSHEFENEFEQQEEKVRGRSRRRTAHTFVPAYSQVKRESEESPRETAFRRSAAGGNGSSSYRGRGGLGDDMARRQVKRRRRWIISLIIAEMFALCFMFGYRYFKHKLSLIQSDPEIRMEEMTNPNISAVKTETMSGYWTVALFGVDSRNSSVGKGNNADVIIICNVNQENGEIKLVSIFRDTYLNIDENSSYNKINQSYFKGGPKQAIEALNRNLDIQIDDYATFNWKAVADAINILGGVDVDISKAEFYYINAYITETVEATGVGSHHLKQAGPNHLDGVQAVAYARLRKMDTDFARTERQRLIMQLCFDKLKKANFSVVNNVMEVVFPQILSSITLDDVIPMAKNLTKYTIADTMGFPAARSDANMGKKGDCVIPQTLESNVISLHQFLFDDQDYQPSDMVKKISAKISADTGMYSEGKPIDHVGTDGGYIPKATEGTTKTEESKVTESTEVSESGTDETDESIIDGEYEWELETDEDGNVIDPPEDEEWDTPGGAAFPSGSHSGTVTPGESTSSSGNYPGSTAPGGTTSPSGSHPGSTAPGGTTSPSGSYPGSTAPGGTTSPSGNYPGTITPGGTTSPSGSEEEPGNVISPGQSSGPGSSTETTSGSRGSTAPYPGALEKETESGGPGSVIIGPGQV